MPVHGLLLTMTEPRPSDEDEFNAWYDTEHIPERLAIPGFVSARRWVAAPRPGDEIHGKYLATYELASPEVLRSAEYLAHVGGHFTPWSRRCLGRTTVFRRWACIQRAPGDVPPAAAAKALFLACGDVPAEHEDELHRWYDEEHVPLLATLPGVLRARRFTAWEGEPRHIALYDLADASVAESPGWQSALETPWAKRIDELTLGSEWILARYAAYDAPPAESYWR
jgi:hypothetical protein